MPSPGRFLRPARLIATLTLASRILGLGREYVFSHFFGTSELLSAYRIAFMLPNLARRLFGEGALSSAMIPILTEHVQQHGSDSARRFVGSLLTVLAVALVVCVATAEAVIAVWRSIHDDLALTLAAILIPYMGLICIVAVGGGVLNVRRHFATPATAPIILNLAIIVGTLTGAWGAGLHGFDLMVVVCVSVLVGDVGQLLATGIAFRAVSFFPLFGGGLRHPQVRAVWALMAPMVLGLSAVQLSTLADYVIAYLFISADGQRVGPAVLGYAQYLYQLPLGVFGIAIATASFPVLSAKGAQGDQAGLADTLSSAVRLSLFLALPATVGLLFVATPLVATVCQHGDFAAADTQRVAAVLVFYSLGLVAYFVQHLLVRAFYAMHDSRTPAKVAICMVAANVALNLALVVPFEERGLALATAACATVQVIWLAIRLAGRLPTLCWRAIARAVFPMLLATAAMAAVLTVFHSGRLLGSLLGQAPVIRLLVLVTLGVSTYVAMARLLRIGELTAVFQKTAAPRQGTGSEEP